MALNLQLFRRPLLLLLSHTPRSLMKILVSKQQEDIFVKVMKIENEWKDTWQEPTLLNQVRVIFLEGWKPVMSTVVNY